MGKPASWIEGMAYQPGVAAGCVRRGLAGGSDRVALIGDGELGSFAEPPAALLVIDGAPFSHRTIELRGLGVPIVLITAGDAQVLEEGAAVVVDGTTGIVHRAAPAEPLPPPPPPAGPIVRSADGVVVDLWASVRSTRAARAAVGAGATAIGLVRSEFLVPPAGRTPDLGYYTQAFAALCDAAAPLPVTIRLIDIAADKVPGWLPGGGEVAGALGLQGSRLYDRHFLRPIVEAQLAALATLATRYDLRVLLPFLARYEELRAWAGFVRERLPVSVPLGAMVETPLAALDVARWFDAVAFAAIGCNDLMQCLFAADRDRPELRDQLDPYAPPLYRFLRQTANDAGARLDDLRLCGLLPQLRGVLTVLLGLGFRKLSVDPPSIPHLAQVIAKTDVADAARLAERVCAAEDSAQVQRLLGIDVVERPA